MLTIMIKTLSQQPDVILPRRKGLGVRGQIVPKLPDEDELFFR
jgi:hypothetical protein